MRRLNNYLYQLPGWPEFIWDANALSAKLAATRHHQGLLIGKIQALGFALQDEAALDNLTLEVVKSSEIEGEILPPDRVLSSIARRLGLDAAGAAPEDRKVAGVVDMMLDATRNFAEPLTAERLFRWHADLFAGGSDDFHKIRIGAWRDDALGPMQVISSDRGKVKVHYEAPPAPRLGREMSAFLAWENRKDSLDPVLKAAIAHLWFVTLHPFDDGNGRIARAIADRALARSENSPKRFYSMSAQIRKERGDYYRILEKTQKDSLDITPWLDWFLGCLDRAFTEAEAESATVLRKDKFWKDHAAVAFNERQRRVLSRLMDRFEGKLTSSKWAKLADCSQDTASRDIADLIARGVLVKDEGGGRSTSYSLKI
jgi:Fic family protein